MSRGVAADPVAVSEVIAILREAGVQHHVQATNDHMVFELGMPRPKYAVRVFASDKEKARELLGEVTREHALRNRSSGISRRRTSSSAAGHVELEPGGGHGGSLGRLKMLQSPSCSKRAFLRTKLVCAERRRRPAKFASWLTLPMKLLLGEIVREVIEATPPT